MDWFNYYGVIIMAIIMLPNIIYAYKQNNKTLNTNINKYLIAIEQIGRYGCFIFMLFNVPYTYFDFWFNNALIIYLIVNGSFCFLYLLFWMLLWNKNNKLKALSLSIIPSFIFLFSGIVISNIPLIFFAILFSFSHILISYKNATNQ